MSNVNFIGIVHSLIRGQRFSVHTLDSFKFGDYRRFWLSGFLSSGVQWIQQVVIGWLAYDVSGSEAITVLALGLGLLPNLITAPIGGTLADRWQRSKLLAVIWGLKSFTYILFSIVVITDRTAVWHIFTFVTIIGLLQSTGFPARNSIIPEVVPKKYVVNAFALELLTSSILLLIIPTLAGLSIAHQGPGYTLLFGALLYGSSAIAVGTINTVVPNNPKISGLSLIREFIDGIRYVITNPILLPIVFIGASAYLLVVPTVHGLLPVYASEVFEVGPVGLGMMGSALGIGAALGSVTIASIQNLQYKGLIQIGALMLTSVAAIALSQSTSLVAAIPFLVLVNLGFVTFTAVRSASIQLITPNSMRGKATAINSMGTGLSPIGGLALGWTAQHFGPPHATLIGSFILVGILLGTVFLFRDLRRF